MTKIEKELKTNRHDNRWVSPGQWIAAIGLYVYWDSPFKLPHNTKKWSYKITVDVKNVN